MENKENNWNIDDIDEMSGDEIELDLEEIYIEQQKIEDSLDSEKNGQTIILPDEQQVQNSDKSLINDDSNLVLDLNIVDDTDNTMSEFDTYSNSEDTIDDTSDFFAIDEDNQSAKDISLFDTDGDFDIFTESNISEDSTDNNDTQEQIVENDDFPEPENFSNSYNISNNDSPESLLKNHEPSGANADIEPVNNSGQNSENYIDNRLSVFEEKFADLTLSVNSETGKELLKISDKLSNLQEIIKQSSLVETEENRKNLNMSFADFREQITLQLVQLFDGISLNQDFVELKNYLDEKFEAINQQFATKPLSVPGIENNNLQPEVNSKKEESVQKEEFPSKESLTEVMETLTNVESDFVKLRVMLNDINEFIKSFSGIITDNVQMTTQLDGICDDISSISKRTNKLILTSEDSQKTINDYLQEFDKTIVNIKQTADILEETPSHISTINTQLKDIIQSIANANNSNKAINNALVYVAQWIDKAGCSLEFIKMELATIKNEKFNQNTTKIGMLEEKIDEINFGLEEYAKLNKSLKSSIDLITEKIDASGSSTKRILAIEDKLDVIEHKLAKFEKSINKITAYIEE